MLFDCGEGTQRQMMRYGTGFGVQSIFVTHLHADHFLGIIGLLRTMGLQGREEPLALFGPLGGGEILRTAAHLGMDRIPFPVNVQELREGDSVPFGDYEVEAFPVRHGTAALGYAIRELPRLGRFDVDRARALGVPQGPLFGKLHRGEAVKVGDRTIRPSEVVGDPRPGRLVVYTGDTRPAETTVEVARGADLLVHEATFTEDEGSRAYETFHSTAKGAAQVALEAGVERLVLTHISARYADNPAPLVSEAQPVFPGTSVAYDGMSMELGYRSDAGEPPRAG